MDDDLTFGASVWGTTEAAVGIVPPRKRPSSPAVLEYHDFDDRFNNSVEVAITEDDDFGDFDEAKITSHTGFEDDATFEEDAPVAGPSSYADCQPLRLDPQPSRHYLEEQLEEILEPLWSRKDLSNFFLGDDIRDVEGVNQILTTPGSRSLYNLLAQSPPPTKPPNWIRSRIRRQHLITLGIPVNLDEVLPRSNVKPLPTLEISTRPMSAPPGIRNSPQLNNGAGATSNLSSRAGTPTQLGRQPGPSSHFGPKPELDHAKIQTLLELDPDTLGIQPLSSLERHLSGLRAQTASVSSLLTHLLQTRESLQQDSETYNGLIAELVGEAQKMKSGKPRTNSIRRGG